MMVPVFDERGNPLMQKTGGQQERVAVGENFFGFKLPALLI